MRDEGLTYVPGFEGLYSITKDGRIFSHGRPARPGLIGGRSFPAKWLKLKYDRDGYTYVILQREGKGYTCKVHRLVLKTFVGEPPDQSYVVNHKNGIRDDNNLDNLEWVTTLENIQDTSRRGTKFTPFANIKGESHFKAKLRDSDIPEIRSRKASGETYAKLSLEYGVSISTLSGICSLQTWKHI